MISVPENGASQLGSSSCASANRPKLARIDASLREETPPILFLGAGTSVQSGVPTAPELAKRLGQLLGIPKECRDFASIREHVQDEDLIRVLFKSISSPRPPSIGYRLLAELIATNVFPIILTTNWDKKLEQAVARGFPDAGISVYLRDYDLDDTWIARHLHRPKHKVILKLHGDEDHAIQFAPNRLMKFDPALSQRLRDLVRSNGIVFLGYSLAEPRIIEHLDEAKFVGVVTPFQEDSASIIDQALSQEVLYSVHNDDGLFDNFLMGLCSKLYEDRLRTRASNAHDPDGVRPFVGEHFDEIVDALTEHFLLQDLPDATVDACVQKLLQSLTIAFPKKARPGTALVFIHDPLAPGGMEICHRIKSDPRSRRAALHEFSVHVVTLEQQFEMTDSGPKEFPRRAGSCQPPLQNCERVVLIDDIAFSGNTLSLVKDFLIKKYELSPDRFLAGLVLVSSEVEKALLLEGWQVFKGGSVDGYSITFPWGVNRPTKPFRGIPRNFSDITQDLTVVDFIVDPTFDFVPKPWGDLTIFSENARCSVRLVDLNKGARTSLHYHLLRNEVFFILDDKVRIQLWDRYIVLRKHQAIRIPAGVPHSLICLEHPCRILEIGTGNYEQRDDLVRVYDPYDRDVDGECDGYA